jgi:predicted SAM-dependent methyltransferase
MRKLNLGCGGNILDGWKNHDADVDISKPLPYEDESFDFIFAEHVCEHLTTPDVVRFFMEAYRVLGADSVIRIAVPSADKIMDNADEAYLAWFGQSGFGDGTRRSAVQSILLNHGHLSAWNFPILKTCLYAAGFEEAYITECRVGESSYEELRGVEGHGKVIGDRNNKTETIIAEAIKHKWNS